MSMVIPNEVISDVNTLESLVFRFTFGKGFGGLIAGLEDGKR